MCITCGMEDGEAQALMSRLVAQFEAEQAAIEEEWYDDERKVISSGPSVYKAITAFSWYA